MSEGDDPHLNHVLNAGVGQIKSNCQNHLTTVSTHVFSKKRNNNPPSLCLPISLKIVRPMIMAAPDADEADMLHQRWSVIVDGADPGGQSRHLDILHPGYLIPMRHDMLR